ncbi:AAA family ATPase [Siccirubricoccus sp. KC 17139]|uniref:AAA family ATPase n=1 Tax=Siccirubricoccus soli TaxID=2899147 RepID=A0ABT1CYD0_9PROT|nr:adenylate/guanylate cyclase domain-containing protein [Siccirubricoccus soli]MCO6414663.1 AAA family ATPase [Siccirubricoccus soli]MCP2680793.1 AAA family ATPase [Siccirubricoccus soli]
MTEPIGATIACAGCGQENPASGRFCGHCGAALARRCEGCGASQPAQFRFCGACGRAFGTPSAPPAGRRAEAGTFAAPQAERRPVSVLFCDLVDSVGLSTRLDPEELGAVILLYRQAAVAAIEAQGGHVTRHVGDGILACFGYPRAHEDDPVRAVRAGLAVLAAMRQVNQRLAVEGQPALALRIGIHTALVMVGDLGSGAARERMALVGEGPNLAARLHQAAAPNALVVSADTWGAVRGYFQGRALGPQLLRGLPRPVEAFEVLGTTGATTRLEASQALTPMVNREEELALLRRAWEGAAGGAGRAVLLRGEAGVGKSRLLQELRSRIPDDNCVGLQCLPEHQTAALQPAVEAMLRLLDLPRATPVEAVRERLEARFAALAPEARAAMTEGLVELLFPGQGSGMEGTPQLRRQRSFGAVLDYLAMRAAERPLMLVIEDVHWADDSTRSLLELLLDRLPGMAMLALLTTRPELEEGWMAHPAVTQLELRRLAPEHTGRMIDSLTRTRPLPEAIRRQIQERTEGVPLFVEELLRAVLDSGALGEGGARPQPLAIPTTLQGSILARLDRLGPARPVAQLCSALGRSFSRRLAAATGEVELAQLDAALDRLVAERFLSRLGSGETATYAFHHALIQDAIYQSMLLARRRRIHRRIAEVLRDGSGGDVAAQPEVLANHLTLAGMTMEAVAAWEAAGIAAAARSASVEAAAHFGQALELAETVPAGRFADAAQRAETMLRLRMALGTQYLVTRGNGAPEVEAAFDAALAESQGITETPMAFRALYGLQTFYIVRGRLEVARRVGGRLLRLAERLGDPGMQVQARRLGGLLALYCGEFARAEAMLRQAWALYERERDAPQRFEYGSDPGVLTLCALGWALWFRGKAEAALEADAAALALAAELAHPHSQAFALCFSASLQQWRGEPTATLDRAEEAVRLARESGFPYWDAWGEMLAGTAEAMLGDAAAIRRLEAGLAAYAGTGGGLMQPYAEMLLADAHLRTGDAAAAERHAAAGLAGAEGNGLRFLDAVLLRLRGAALAGRDAAAAAAALRQAVAVAEAQGAAGEAAKACQALAELAEGDRQTSVLP